MLNQISTRATQRRVGYDSASQFSREYSRLFARRRSATFAGYN